MAERAQDSPLLRLPAEVRNNICRLVFGEPEQGYGRDFRIGPPKLLSTCRQIRTEAGYPYYACQTFAGYTEWNSYTGFDDWMDHLASWLKSLAPDSLWLLRTVLFKRYQLPIGPEFRTLDNIYQALTQRGAGVPKSMLYLHVWYESCCLPNTCGKLSRHYVSFTAEQQPRLIAFDHDRTKDLCLLARSKKVAIAKEDHAQSRMVVSGTEACAGDEVGREASGEHPQ